MLNPEIGRASLVRHNSPPHLDGNSKRRGSWSGGVARERQSQTSHQRSEPAMTRGTKFQRIDQRIVPDYDRQVLEARAELSRLRPSHSKKKAKALGRLGMLLLAHEKTAQEGLQLLNQACEIAAQNNHQRLAAANGIRRATAFQYCGDHAQAVAVFNDVLELITRMRLRKLRDFALQHKGKCLAEMGDDAGAHECFIEALRIRKQRKATDLISSTTRAISAIKRTRRSR